ncbi:anti-sigma F factor [Halothermothrix orenii]|uniref:Putative anti-sigma regulatory factor, serine/threonine protein kinase n=1 Tax=Halothermothrix orenii (strain H 168 / OCM 544 / DSM 9562) TaxID=373903 RepID=B8CVY9_HALOH|nr:anti-sigma F factor [Halothermothrix orenii]ACL69458.1 putative anti-sigma regulatory factor, serine/threonine protein kinase [Halothermothrix orenii H 168]
MRNQAHLKLLSKSSNVGLARVAVATFASELDFTLNELEEIKVAVSEAVTNCIIHGYPMKEGTIDIEMEITGDKLTVIVTDYGVGIEDVEAVLRPSFTTKDEHMGLGLAFIDSFMDDFKLESELNKGTRVIMVKVPERYKQVKK